MSVATESELEPIAKPAAPPPAIDEEAAKAAEAAARRSVRPLLGLVPFVARYRWRTVAALAALIVAAGATLAVPIAVRRMIDNGFDAEHAGLIDNYFGM